MQLEFMPIPGLVKPVQAREKAIEDLGGRFKVTTKADLGFTVDIYGWDTSAQAEVRRIAHTQGFQPSENYREPVWLPSWQQQSRRSNLSDRR